MNAAASAPIDYADALALLRAACVVGPSETCASAAAAGRVLAQPVIAGASLPGFDNSAMDGYALPLTAVAEAGCEFLVHGEQAAGDGLAVAHGAVEIMTGARLPDGASTVVPVELTEALEHAADGRVLRFRLREALQLDANIRRAGEDVAAGVQVLPAGRLIDAEAQMLLSALGVAELQVRRRTAIALIATGRELVDDPRAPLSPGQIRNSNLPYLRARVSQAGGDCVHAETVGDDVEQFLAALQRGLAAGAGLVISTGAVSMGRYDFVPEALRRIGARIVFHKTRIRPGKPILFARLPDGGLYFGLPGNPVSTAVGFRFFVEPALRAIAGLPAETWLRLPLHAPIARKPALRLLLKARALVDQQGRLSVAALAGQESFRILPLLDTTGWIVLPETSLSLAAGELVEVASPCHLQPLALMATS